MIYTVTLSANLSGVATLTYTTEDADLVRRHAVLPEERIAAVRTGGCPHTAIRDDITANLDAIDDLIEANPPLELILVESVGVNLTATLRILVDIMATTGSEEDWAAAADRVRHGGKLSDTLSVANSLPPMAVRMLRLGEETGQLPALSGRVAEFYEAKLHRSLDRVVGIVGPLAIVTISTVVGGLIVSVMTALLSVTQLVG